MGINFYWEDKELYNNQDQSWSIFCKLCDLFPLVFVKARDPCNFQLLVDWAPPKDNDTVMLLVETSNW
jgi:hypothetical protein